jgi:hypothetical protein
MLTRREVFGVGASIAAVPLVKVELEGQGLHEALRSRVGAELFDNVVRYRARRRVVGLRP